MEISKEAFSVPRNLDEAKELIDKLKIEDLRTFCFTFGFSQEGTKANLKGPVIIYRLGGSGVFLFLHRRNYLIPP